MKDRIDKFSEGIPQLMSALDELAKLHPFIGGALTQLHVSMRINQEVVAVLAFKTAYTLERRRRDNEKKIISLFVGMKDMMGALLLYVLASVWTEHAHIRQPQGHGECQDQGTRWYEHRGSSEITC